MILNNLLEPGTGVQNMELHEIALKGAGNRVIQDLGSKNGNLYRYSI